MDSTNVPLERDHSIQPSPSDAPESLGSTKDKRMRVSSSDATNVPLPPPMPSSDTARPSTGRSIAAKKLTRKQQAKQDAALKKLKKSASEVPTTTPSFERAIQMGADAMKLRQITDNINAVSSETSFQLPTFGKTQNPVAKIGGAQFLPLSALRAQLDAEVKLTTVDIMSTVMNLARLGTQFKEVAAFTSAVEAMATCARELSGAVKESRGVPDQVKAQKFTAALDSTVKELSKVMRELNFMRLDPSSPDYEERKKLRAELSKMVTTIKEKLTRSISLANVSLLYEKDAVLSQLRASLANNPHRAVRSDLLEAIQKLGKTAGSYVSAALLDELDSTYRFQVDRRQITPFVSTTEFVVANHNLTQAIKIVQKAAKAAGVEEPQFIFKTGDENTRELLAGKLAASMSLAQALVPKSEVTVDSAVLGSTQNPEGIASRFLEGGSALPDTEWSELMEAKKKLAIAKFKYSEVRTQVEAMQEEAVAIPGKIQSLTERQKALETYAANLEQRIQDMALSAGRLGSNIFKRWWNRKKINHLFANIARINPILRDVQSQVPVIKGQLMDLTSKKAEWDRLDAFRREVDEAAQAYEEAKSAVKALGGTQSIATHALTDALFCAYDSHINQYILKDETVYNVDFARFMAPHEAVTLFGSVLLTFRSALMDHPSCDDPMSSETIETILGWNVDHIESQWRQDGLIGTPEEFATAQRRMERLLTDTGNLDNANKQKLRELCAAYHVPVNENLDVMRKSIRTKLNAEFTSLKKQCYEKVHPEAFKAFKTRTLALQAYVKQCQAMGEPATLKGAFPHMYPLMAPFMTVAERLVENPGSFISVERVEMGSPRFRSLQSIIKQARESKLATESELQAMEAALLQYKKQAPPTKTLMTTMNLG